MKYFFLLLYLSISFVYGDGFVISSRTISLGDESEILSLNETKKVRFNIYYTGTGARPSGIGKFELTPTACLADHVVTTNLTGWQAIPENSSAGSPIIVEFALHVFDIPGGEFCDVNLTTVCPGDSIFPFTLSLNLDHDGDVGTPFMLHQVNQLNGELEFMRNPGNAIVLTEKLAEYVGPTFFSSLNQAQVISNVYPQAQNFDDQYFLVMDWNSNTVTSSPWDNIGYFRFPVSATCEVVLAHEGSSPLTQYEGTVFRQNGAELEELVQSDLGGAGLIGDVGAGINIFDVTNGQMLGTGACSGSVWSTIDYTGSGPFKMYFITGLGFILRDIALYKGEEISCDVVPADVYLGTGPEFDTTSISLEVVDSAYGETYLKCKFNAPVGLLKPGFSIDWKVEDATGRSTGYLAQSTTGMDVLEYDGFVIDTAEIDRISVRAIIKYEEGLTIKAQAGIEKSFAVPLAFTSGFSLTQETVNNEPDYFFDPGERVQVNISSAVGGQYYHGFTASYAGQDRLVLSHAGGHKVFNTAAFVGLDGWSGVIGVDGYLGDLESDVTLIEGPYLSLSQPASGTVAFDLVKAPDPVIAVDSAATFLLVFGYEEYEGSNLSLLYRKEFSAKDEFNPYAPSFLDHDFNYVDQIDFTNLKPWYSLQDPKVNPGVVINQGSSDITTDPDGLYGWRWNPTNAQYDCTLSPLLNRGAAIPVYYLYTDPIPFSSILTIEINQIREFYANWNYGGSLEYRVINNQLPGPWININQDPNNAANFSFNDFPFSDLGYMGSNNCLLNAYGENAWTESTDYGPEDPLTRHIVQFASGQQLQFRIFAENPDETFIPSGFNWAITDWKILFQDTVQDNYFGVLSRIVSSCTNSYLEFYSPATHFYDRIQWYASLEAVYNDSYILTSPSNLLPPYTGTFYARIIDSSSGTSRLIELQKAGTQISWVEFLASASQWPEPPIGEESRLLNLIEMLVSVCTD